MDTIPSIQSLRRMEQENSECQVPEGENTEEMDQMFESAGPYTDEFSVRQLSHQSGSAVWKPGYLQESDVHTREIEVPRVRDMDLHEHRRDSFPHVHAPLKPSHHFLRRLKDRWRGEHYHSENEEGEEEGPEHLPDGKQLDDVIKKEPKACIQHAVEEAPPTKSASGKEMKAFGTEAQQPYPVPPPRKRTASETGVHSTDDELMETFPLISPYVAKLRSIIRPYDTESEDEAGQKKGGRVQFNIGSDVGESEHEQRPKPHRKRRHRKRIDGFEDPESRRRLGSEKLPPEKRTLFFYSDAGEEVEQLQEHELDQISSHRFEDKGVHRRHHLRARASIASIIHPSECDVITTDKQLPFTRKVYDHSPHEVFVELSELQQTNVGGLEWKEKARWIKFEEDVEGVENRWGKPHIAFLNFNSLFNLRKGLERGAVLLDLDESDLPSIATRVVDHMVACDQIPTDQRDAVIKILLLRHKHNKEHQRSFRRASRSSRGSKVQLGFSEEKLSSSQSAVNLEGGLAGVRKSLSNIFHVHTFGSFTRSASVGDEMQASQYGMKLPSRQASFTQIDLDGELDSRERERAVKNLELMKKIPDGAEATAVLVGAVDFLKQPTIAFVRLAGGVVMENVIEVPIPVRFLFVLLGPFHGDMDYHEVGRSISTLMSDKAFHEVAYRAHTRGQLLSAINDFLNASIVLPPSDWSDKDLVPIDDIRAKTQEIIRKNENIRAKRKQSLKVAEATVVTDEGGGDKKPPKRDPLKRYGKLFFGLTEDIKCRYPGYWCDIRDGLSPQVVSATIFIFFAALSPAITFGGMYADKTNKLIGVGETLLISSINGIIFALFAAQPLLIVGSTGPLMIFDMSLLSFCESSGLDFLAIRVWVGIWMVVIGLLVTAFEVIAVVKKFTRFTEELFSTLVCIIFIYGAFESLASIFKTHPLTGPSENCFMDLNNTGIDADDLLSLDSLGNVSGILINGILYNGTNMYGEEVTEDEVKMNQPNTALLSMCLMVGTFLIAWKLKKFRNSKFLGRSVRRALGDFGVPIAIFLMVLLDYCIKDTYTDKLSMPKGLQPSNSEVRGWIINPLGVISPLPVWCMVAAGPAALLLFILIFIEGNICQLILTKPERCLKKGSGFHLDILLSCLINTVAGFFGAPFMGPACVRTISHMSALTVMTTNVPPGEPPKIIGCIEQRLSPFLVSLLVGLAVMLYSVLNLVPTAVLLGIFLYMGVSATAGIQFLERIVLYVMPVKHHPNVPYVRKVRTWKMHSFTGVQFFLLIVLWIVKQSPASLCIPFILLCLIPIRMYLLPFIFTSQELIALDGKEQSTPETIAEDEPDFYETVHHLPTQIEEEEEEEDHTHQS